MTFTHNTAPNYTFSDIRSSNLRVQPQIFLPYMFARLDKHGMFASNFNKGQMVFGFVFDPFDINIMYYVSRKVNICVINSSWVVFECVFLNMILGCSWVEISGEILVVFGYKLTGKKMLLCGMNVLIYSDMLTSIIGGDSKKKTRLELCKYENTYLWVLFSFIIIIL